MKPQRYYSEVMAEGAAPKSNKERVLDRPTLGESLHCNWSTVSKSLMIVKFKKRVRCCCRSEGTQEGGWPLNAIGGKPCYERYLLG